MLRTSLRRDGSACIRAGHGFLSSNAQDFIEDPAENRVVLAVDNS